MDRGRRATRRRKLGTCLPRQSTTTPRTTQPPNIAWTLSRTGERGSRNPNSVESVMSVIPEPHFLASALPKVSRHAASSTRKAASSELRVNEVLPPLGSRHKAPDVRPDVSLQALALPRQGMQAKSRTGSPSTPSARSRSCTNPWLRSRATQQYQALRCATPCRDPRAQHPTRRSTRGMPPSYDTTTFSRIAAQTPAPRNDPSHPLDRKNRTATPAPRGRGLVLAHHRVKCPRTVPRGCNLRGTQ